MSNSEIYIQERPKKYIVCKICGHLLWLNICQYIYYVLITFTCTHSVTPRGNLASSAHSLWTVRGHWNSDEKIVIGRSHF